MSTVLTTRSRREVLLTDDRCTKDWGKKECGKFDDRSRHLYAKPELPKPLSSSAADLNSGRDTVAAA